MNYCAEIAGLMAKGQKLHVAAETRKKARGRVEAIDAVGRRHPAGHPELAIIGVLPADGWKIGYMSDASQEI